MEESKVENQQKSVEYVNDFPQDKVEEFGYENQKEMTFQLFQKKILFKKRFLKIGAIVIVSLAVFVAMLVLYARYRNNASDVQEEIAVDLPENKDHVFVNDVNGISENDEVVDKPEDFSGLIGRSENYHIKDIAIGGGTIVITGETENLPIAIRDVRTETMLSKDGKEMKLLISWKTNKLSRSNVKYVKDGTSAEKFIREDSFGFSHALVMNKLEQATRYSFTVEASDRQGNKIESDTFAAYTGIKPESVFELISREISKMFGWAIKK